IVPISSFGFGNAVRKNEDGAGPTQPTAAPRSAAVPPLLPRVAPEERGIRDAVLEEGAGAIEPDETVWTVRRDALIVPFNVNTLMVWSLLHGLRVQEVDP